MNWTVQYLWLIPALPAAAAGLSALAPRRCRAFAASLAIGSMLLSLALSLCALAHVMTRAGAGAEAARDVVNIPWLRFGGQWLKLGWVLDPLSAVMLVMVSFVGLLIFIYSLGYMARDGNFTRFFCFLSLFAGAMLGLVIANSLLLLFICWELVGLTSYLLIGFWFHKPSAAAAAKKAVITTRIGDLALLIGMVWLYARSGTLLFYDNGYGCLETDALATLVLQTTGAGLTVSAAIGLLIFLGAMGKSGQVPLHVWLPDAMEGPTPVSALIHAATMVAAGVYLVARVYPLMAECAPGGAPETVALQAVAWVGAITAFFASAVAVAQTDIKRILAYSTISQLGYMMLGLGVGGVAVGMFHLIAHAFFKALLFLGAGSVIHGCREEQDIRRMGGLRRFMPVTFAAYGIGMLALSGFPLLFSGFWSKDEILHAANGWAVSRVPFGLGLAGALLTAFYMTRQVVLVFFGRYRGAAAGMQAAAPHESPPVMTVPMLILAACSIVLGFVGTPAWPWFAAFLDGETVSLDLSRFSEGGLLPLMAVSSGVVFCGIGLGWWLYGRKPVQSASDPDPLDQLRPDVFGLLRGAFRVDDLYESTVIRFNAWWSRACVWLDTWVWDGAVQLVTVAALGLAWLNRLCDEYLVNPGFDGGCRRLTQGGKGLSNLQTGRVQDYLRGIGIALVVLVLLLIWGGGR
jgi:NADH-quinone oxidoreductase subunit L